MKTMGIDIAFLKTVPGEGPLASEAATAGPAYLQHQPLSSNRANQTGRLLCDGEIVQGLSAHERSLFD
jgi:hypothetical protein